jgi:hypothetical protein
VAVYLARAAPEGAALIDREVYLPTAWTDDRARYAAAGVPDAYCFKTRARGLIWVSSAGQSAW